MLSSQCSHVVQSTIVAALPQTLVTQNRDALAMTYTPWPRRKKQKCKGEEANPANAAPTQPAVLQNARTPWTHRQAKRKRRSDAHGLGDVPDAVPNAKRVRIERRVKKRKLGTGPAARTVERKVAATPAADPVPEIDATGKIANRLGAGRTESRLHQLMHMHLFQQYETRTGDALQPLPGVFGTVDGALSCILAQFLRRGVLFVDTVPLTSLPSDAFTFVAKLDQVKTVKAGDVLHLNLDYEILPQSRRTTKSFRFRKRQGGQFDFQQLQALRTTASWNATFVPAMPRKCFFHFLCACALAMWSHTH